MQTVLYRRPGSLLYWHHYTDDRGFPVEHCTGTTSLREAERVAAERFGAVPRTTDPAPDPSQTCADITLEDALELFLSSCPLDLSPATVKCYQQKGGHVVRLLGDHPLCKLRVQHVQAYAQRRIAEGAARESLRKELVVLRSTLQLARDRGILDRDPESMIPRFRAPYKPRRRWLSTDELSALLRNLPPNRQRWVLLAVFTGARLGEVEKLTWGDLDFERAQIHIRGTKTVRADRHIPLHAELAELLRPLQAARSEAVAGTWNNVRRALRLACQKAQIEPVSPNDLRRTFASWLKQAGQDSLAVGKLLGHTSSRMVELVYGHLDQKALTTTMEHLPDMGGILQRVGNPTD